MRITCDRCYVHTYLCGLAAVKVFTDHCMHGWRQVFCVLDNCVPHREVMQRCGDDCPCFDDPPGVRCMIARFPFTPVCRLHDWAGFWGYDDKVEDPEGMHERG
jgi:hypothetical protein